MVLADVRPLKLSTGAYRWVWNTANGLLVLIRADRLRFGNRVNDLGGG